MKPANFILLLIILPVVFSCYKEEEIKPLPEQGYPITYKPLPQNEWEALNAEFQKINSYAGLSLNEFGFVKGEIPISINDSISKEFVFDRITEIINIYRPFLGFPENHSFDFDKNVTAPFYGMMGGDGMLPFSTYFEWVNQYKETGYWESVKEKFQIQRFYLHQNSLNGLSFLGPSVLLTFDEISSKIKITGNWFPNAKIPSNEIYSIDEALSLAYFTILDATGKDLWEVKHTFKIKKLLYPITISNNTEIHECWEIKTDLDEYHYYTIYIDTQTGTIVRHFSRAPYLY